MLAKSRRLLSAHGLDLGLLLLRAWFGLMLAFGHGWGKMSGFQNFKGFVASQGFWAPDLAAGFAVGSEVLGGLLLALGLAFRPAALAVAGTMLAAALIVHGSDPLGKQEPALGFAVVAIALFLAGPGKLTLSRLIQGRKKD